MVCGLGLGGVRHSKVTHCEICGRPGGMPTSLRSNTHLFSTLLPASFLSMYLCLECHDFALYIAKAAKTKALRGDPNVE
jgi:hypothetical protein